MWVIGASFIVPNSFLQRIKINCWYRLGYRDTVSADLQQLASNVIWLEDIWQDVNMASDKAVGQSIYRPDLSNSSFSEPQPDLSVPSPTSQWERRVDRPANIMAINGSNTSDDQPQERRSRWDFRRLDQRPPRNRSRGRDRDRSKQSDRGKIAQTDITNDGDGTDVPSEMSIFSVTDPNPAPATARQNSNGSKRRRAADTATAKLMRAQLARSAFSQTHCVSTARAGDV